MAELRYVNLSRSFVDCDDPTTTTLPTRILGVRTHLLTLGWKEILASRYAIVLGEPGSGKTFELRECARSLRASGSHAFFRSVRDLCQSGLARSPTELEALRKWRNGSGGGLFLLDSLDEARLGSSALDAALNRLVDEIETDWRRVRLVLTCRVADWRGEADLALLRGYLPTESVVSEERTGDEVGVDVRDAPRTVHSSKAPDRPAPIRVVRLAPLSEEQALLLAGESGARSLPELREAVSRSEAWAFLERPADVLSLVGSWNSRGEIGTLTQLMEDMVSARLTEYGDDRTRLVSLTLELARTCAERLALAATVMREPRMRRPGGYDDALRTVGLRVESVLDDLSPTQLAEFLDRGIFVDDGYGLLGFHHRATQEYLAARHLLALRQQELSSRRLQGMFLRCSYGEEVVVPSLRGLAGWVACRNATFRHALVRVDPLLFLEHGDPAAIPPAERAEILRKAVAYMHDCPWRRPQSGHADFARFGCAELAPIAHAYLVRADAATEIVHYLLRLVAYGRLRECAADALALALRHGSDETVGYAVHAAAGAGDGGVRRALVNRACSATERRPDFLVEVARCLYPKSMTSAELAAVMVRWAACAGDSAQPIAYGSPWYFLDDLPTPGAIDEVAAVLGDALGTRLRAAPGSPDGNSDGNGSAPSGAAAATISAGGLDI